MPRLRKYLGVSLCRVMARPIDARAPGADEGGGIEYRPMTEAELRDWCADSELELRPDWVQNAMARGDLCVGALDRGRLVGYLWLAYRAARYTDAIWIRIDALSRYTYKMFVRPGCRGRGIAQGLYRRSDDPALARGRSRAILVVELDNQASLRAAQRNGLRTIGYAGYASWRGRVLAFRTPGARRHGLRFYNVPPPRMAPAWGSLAAGALVAFLLASVSGPPPLASPHSLDLAWEAASGLIALGGFALRFAAAGAGARYPLHLANLVIVAAVMIDIRSAWLMLAAAAAYWMCCEPERLPRMARVFSRLLEGAFSARKAIGSEYQTLFAIVAVFTAIEIGHDFSVLGRLELDPVWQVVFTVNLALYFALRSVRIVAKAS